MLNLISNHPTEDPRKLLFSAISCELTQDDELNLPAELAAHICDCQIAAVSFHSSTKFFVKKGLAEWLGFKEKSYHRFILPAEKEVALVIQDLSIDPAFHKLPNMILPGNIQFLATVPIRLEAGTLIGSLTVMGVEKKDQFPETHKIALEKIAEQIGRLAFTKNDCVQLSEEKPMLKTEELQQELKLIAYKMHEDFAQTLAATKLYLEFAEDDQHASKHFLQISKDTIEQVIQKMRTLCTTIAPQSLETKLV